MEKCIYNKTKNENAEWKSNKRKQKSCNNANVVTFLIHLQKCAESAAAKNFQQNIFIFFPFINEVFFISSIIQD